MRFLLFMGLVSLFADMSYEGARSVSGALLATLGISAFMLGFVTGFGEFLGYAFRIASGYIADKTRAYWFLAFLGYFLVFSIPLIYFANSWQVVAFLLILERLGKAFRNPARDAILSFATAKMGVGKGFGIHEALDQIGAIVGPIIVSLALYAGYGYRESFGFLFFPVLFAILFLFVAKKEYTGEIVQKEQISSEIAFCLYMLFTILSLAGLANFQLIAYHFELRSVFSREMIPVIYALAMGADAVSALISGKFFDKFGLRTLFAIPLLSPFCALFAFHAFPVLGAIIFGLVLGMHESIGRAAVARLSSEEKRAFSYGIFNTANGLGLLIGGIMFGFLYDFSLELMIVFSFIVELVAALFLLPMLKTKVKKVPLRG